MSARRIAIAGSLLRAAAKDFLAKKTLGIIVDLKTHDAHFPVTTPIPPAGKHGFSQMPLVLSLEQGEQLRRLTEENDKAHSGVSLSAASM